MAIGGIFSTAAAGRVDGFGAAAVVAGGCAIVTGPIDAAVVELEEVEGAVGVNGLSSAFTLNVRRSTGDLLRPCPSILFHR